MRHLTGVFLVGAYLFLSLAAGGAIWRNGGGWGAGLASFVAVFSLFAGLHALIARIVETRALRRELDAMRKAHVILLDQVERVDARVTEVVETVADDVVRRSEELTTEVQMLEDLVQRMGERLDERTAPQPAPVTRIHPGARPAAALLETVRDSLAENRVDLYLQPIVSLPQRRTAYYESFSRLRDAAGRVLMPAEFLSVADAEGLVTSLDNLLLFRCVQIVRRLAKQDRKVGIFCNISAASLADETFFPQFLELMAANRDLSNALIFELGQAAFDARSGIEARNMGKLADLGFRFSLDKVTDLDLDFQDLARSDVKFVKIAGRLLLDELTETEDGFVFRSLPDLAAEDFANLTRRYGVELIAEKVESEREIVDILELDIAYGQGNLFGEPRPIRDSVLQETDPPAETRRPPVLRRVGGRG